MNLFRFLGDLSHLLAIILLLLKIWKSRSCAGESPRPAERGRERAALGHREGRSSAGQSPPGLPAGYPSRSRVTRGSASFPRLRGAQNLVGVISGAQLNLLQHPLGQLWVFRGWEPGAMAGGEVAGSW